MTTSIPERASVSCSSDPLRSHFRISTPRSCIFCTVGFRTERGRTRATTSCNTRLTHRSSRLWTCRCYARSFQIPAVRLRSSPRFHPKRRPAKPSFVTWFGVEEGGCGGWVRCNRPLRLLKIPGESREGRGRIFSRDSGSVDVIKRQRRPTQG